MRLSRVVVEAFRGFTTERSFDCDADVVLIVGPNGTGKTSFFDAVTWALFGEIRRLRGSRDAVRDGYVESKFAQGTPPSVDLYLTGEQGPALIARRGGALRVVTDADTALTGKAAQRWVDDLVLAGRASSESAEQIFLRTTLLGQEEMAAFLRTTTPRERFDSLSSLLGVDVVRDFYIHIGRLSRSLADLIRTAEVDLSRVQLRLESIRLHLADQEARAAQIREASRARVVDNLRMLSTDAASLGADVVDVASNASAVELRDVAADVEAQIYALQERRAATANALRDLIAQQPTIDEGLERIEQASPRRLQLDEQLAALGKEQHSVERQMARIGSARRKLEQRASQAQQHNDELVEFLVSGQRHIEGDRCPLCEQPIKADDLRRDLKRRLAAAPGGVEEIVRERRSLDDEETSLAERLGDLAERTREISSEITAIESERQRVVSLHTRWLASVRRTLGREGGATAKSLQRAVDSEMEASGRLNALQPKVSLVARQTETLAAIDEVVGTRERERTTSTSAAEASARLEALRRWDRVFVAFASAARKAEADLVAELLRSQHPVVRSLYQRLRPHPVFTEIDVEFKLLADNRGEAYFMASSADGHGNVSTIYSTAQLSAVAVCVFVALNLARAGGGLNAMMMDDPVQSMDDYNALGLVDVLRLAGQSRQLFVASHDDQIGALMRRKLRPLSRGSRTIVHRYTDFTAAGPNVLTVVDEFHDGGDIFRQPLKHDATSA